MSDIRSDVRLLYAEAVRAIRRSKNALLICHIDPDCDTLGSMLGFSYLLDRLGIRSTLFCKSKIPKAYSFLPRVQKVIHRLPKERFHLAAVFDSGSLSRIGLMDLRSHADHILNVDHHPDNQRFGDTNLIEPKAAATSEVVYQLFKKLKKPIVRDAAISLYAALVTDTGSFHYENTREQTFLMAADLVRSGTNPKEVSQAIYENRPESSLRILGLAIQKMRKTKGGALVWSTLTPSMMREARADDQDINGIIDTLRSIDRTEVAVLFRQTDAKKVKVNFRSKTYVNVSRIAKSLGGGGHVRASGCVLEGPLPQIEKKVIRTVLHEWGPTPR